MPVRKAATFAVRAAVIDLLSTSEEATALTDNQVRVFEDVPEDQPFPYYQVTTSDATDAGASEHEAKTVALVVHAYSRAEGSYEAEEMLQVAYELLRNADLDLSQDGHRLTLLTFLSGGVGGDPDGQSYHGVHNYRAITEEV